MSKGLEALEKIKQAEYFVDFELDAKIKDDYKIELAIIEKELKALEIIKEKKVFVANLIYHFERDDNVIEYNQKCGWAKSELTQEEYDLLKEVLL